VGGRRGGRRSGRRGGRRGRRQRLNNGSLSLIRWRLLSRLERRETFRVRRGVQRRIWLVLRLV
jgi:hypothetical protein